MKTIACYKVVLDVQDIDAYGSGDLNFDKAASVLGEYDLVAIEQAVRIAEASEDTAVLLSVGGKRLNDSKIIKSALSRGASKLIRVMDERLDQADSYQNARVLAAALSKLDFDVLVFGEGSSDYYSQQVGILVASMLDIPVVNAVKDVEISGDSLLLLRDLDSVQERIELKTPCAICMTSDAVLPRVPALRDILAAGKKPVEDLSLDSLGGVPESSVETIVVRATKNVERKGVIYESASEENIQKLAQDIKTSL